MKGNQKKVPTLVAIAAATLLGGCASGLTTVAPTPPTEYSTLGSARGSACGSLGVIATAYNFVPMGLNTRVERAYADALGSVNGATSLINVTMQEDWYWWVLGTARCVTITGEAVK